MKRILKHLFAPKKSYNEAKEEMMRELAERTYFRSLIGKEQMSTDVIDQRGKQNSLIIENLERSNLITL
jgi:hypothetical protein